MADCHDPPSHPATGPGANCGPGQPVPCPVEPEYHLHVDADRNGTVDDDRTGIDSWNWGAGLKGAIVLCNNDDDQGASASDNSDNHVNAGNDGTELAPVEIRRIGPPPPGGWTGFLEVDASDQNFFRLFESRTSGSPVVLGKDAVASFPLPTLNFARKEFWMEATQYADDTFSGEFNLRFRLNKNGTDTTETARFRVAPWVMPNHLDHAERVFVVEAGAGVINTPAGASDNSRFRTELNTHVTAAGCTLHTHPNNDIWMQDCMELGYSNLPTTGFRSVMRAPRPRPLRTFPVTLRTADFGYHEQGTMAPASTFDSTGNLECTPSVTVGVKRYPWGRIYFGPGRPLTPMDAATQAFLRNQIVQNPITIDTNWLAVGHVDEIISIIPSPGPKGFKLLLASPARAYDILNSNHAAHGTSHMLVGRQFPEIDPITDTLVGWHSAEVSIHTFLTTGIAALRALWRPVTNHFWRAAELRTFNNNIQTTLDSIKAQLQTDLGLDPADFISVPILYMPNAVGPSRADAMTGGMVNMLVVNGHCIVPKPFGPVVGGVDLYEQDLRTQLAPTGVTIHILDDWYEYHVNLGEVHCGTNTKRTPTTARWWEFVP